MRMKRKQAISPGLSIVGTSEAAKYLNRTPGTLRQWAFHGNGAIQPLRIGGRLAWRVADIESLLRNGD